MDDQQRYENARSVSEEIQHSTVEELQSGDLADPIDNPDKDREKKETSSKVGDRLQRAREQIKGRVERFNQRYPQVSEAARYAGKGIGFAAKKTTVGRFASSAKDLYDVYQHGKQLDDFIREAQTARKAEERAAKGRSFYERAAKTRQRTVGKIEWQLNDAYQTGKVEKVNWVDEVRHTNHEKISRLSQELESAKNDRSLEEVLAKSAPNSELNARFAQSREIADEYRKSLMKGEAQDKYHYLLDESRQALGDDYYDLAKHPQRAVKFDRFAAQRLYEDGMAKEGVKQAIEQGAFQPALGKSQFAKEYNQRTWGSIGKESDLVREKVVEWQFDYRTKLDGAKINPKEIENLNSFKTQAEAYRTNQTRDVRYLAQQILKDYKADNAQWNRISTQEEYLIEAGRRIEAGKSPSDKEIVRKLMLADRDDKSIVETLKEFSPNMNNSSKLSEKFLRDLRIEHQQDTKFWNDLQNVRNFREAHGISDTEKRIDRLQLSYDRQEATQSRANQIGETTKNIMNDTRSNSHEMSEIER